MTEPLDPSTTLVRDANALSRIVLDGILILPPGTGDALHISTPGDVIWDLLRHPVRVSELLAMLADRFDLDEPEIRHDVEPVLQALIDADVLRA